MSKIPNNLKVYGVGMDGEILLWDWDKRRLHRISSVNDLTEARIIQTCGSMAYNEVAVQCLEENERCSPAREIKNAIADEARRNMVGGQHSLGAGLWKNPAGSGLLLVSGNQAYTIIHDETDTIVAHVVDGPTVGSRMLDFEEESWVSPVVLAQTMNGLNSREIWKKICRAIRSWPFKEQVDYSLVAGLLIATAIQGVLDFRPHVWVTGPTDSRKTALRKMMESLWPYAHAYGGETSAAAIRQRMQRRVLPLLLDEQRAWRGMNELMVMLRSSTRGELVAKGTASQEGLVFGLRHIAWLFAPATYNLGAEDVNRFIVLELRRRKGEEKIQMLPNDDLQQLGLEIVASAVALHDRIADLFRFLISQTEVLDRRGELYAVPIAAAAAMIGLDRTAALKMFRRIIHQKTTDMAEQSDEQALLMDILMAVPPHHQDQVITLLQVTDRFERKSAELSLAEVGIKKVDGGSDIFFATEPIKRKLLKGTKWADVQIREYLMRLPGAVYRKRRINDLPSPLHGVQLPAGGVIGDDSSTKIEPQVMPLIQIPVIAPVMPLVMPPVTPTQVINPPESDDTDLEDLLKAVLLEKGE
jgi:hypothetical protein